MLRVRAVIPLVNGYLTRTHFLDCFTDGASFVRTGTYAYVSAGHLGKSVILNGEGSLPVESWQLALIFGITLLTLGIVGQTAKNALKEVE